MTTPIRHEQALAKALQAVRDAKDADALFEANEALFAVSEALLDECEVLNPQDIEWGTCRENTDEDNGPHHVATNMCVWCLEYDPE